MKIKPFRVEVPDQSDAATPDTEYVRWMTQLQADLAKSLGGVMLQAAQPVAVGSAPGGSLRPLSSPGRIVGWSIRETTGTAGAVVTLWDGREPGTRPLAYVSLDQGKTETI